jgi:hypothetical protein
MKKHSADSYEYWNKSIKGRCIMRLDAHAQYPTNYFSILVKALKSLDADNVGAACRTDVLNKHLNLWLLERC